MSHKMSKAEKDGMSFEERCKDALAELKGRLKMIQEISTESVRFRNNEGKAETTFLDKLHGQERDKMKALLDGLSTDTMKIDERFYEGMWRNGLEMARDNFGDDAVAMAEEMLKREKKGN